MSCPCMFRHAAVARLLLLLLPLATAVRSRLEVTTCGDFYVRTEPTHTKMNVRRPCIAYATPRGRRGYGDVVVRSWVTSLEPGTLCRTATMERC